VPRDAPCAQRRVCTELAELLVEIGGRFVEQSFGVVLPAHLVEHHGEVVFRLREVNCHFGIRPEGKGFVQQLLSAHEVVLQPQLVGGLAHGDHDVRVIIRSLRGGGR
jgi:hypothetical protein